MDEARLGAEKQWMDEEYDHKLDQDVSEQELQKSQVGMMIGETNEVQGDSGGRIPWLGWLRFGMFHHPAWAVGSYSSGPPAGGTPQI